MRIGPEIDIPDYLMREENFSDRSALNPGLDPSHPIESGVDLRPYQHTFSLSAALVDRDRSLILNQANPAHRESIQLRGQESIERARLLTKRINLEDIKEKFGPNGVYASNFIPKSLHQDKSTQCCISLEYEFDPISKKRINPLFTINGLESYSEAVATKEAWMEYIMHKLNEDSEAKFQFLQERGFMLKSFNLFIRNFSSNDQNSSCVADVTFSPNSTQT